MLGLEAVSQVWNGSAAWYLWLRRAPGVYALTFSQGDVVATNGHRLLEGQFALKCYPFADHSCFAGYSEEERRLVQSDRFDATHTPRFEAAEQIPDSLFTVGSISMLCKEEEDLALLSYQSLDALRFHETSKASAGSNMDHKPAAAHLVRNVAGWAIGYPFFDCRVGLYVHFVGRVPAFIGVASCPGFEYTIFADGRAECLTSQASIQTALTIGFAPPGSDTDRIASLWQDRLESDEEIQTAWRLPDFVDGAVGLDLPDNVKLNPLWWKVAASDFRSELNSLCGCSEAHCSHSKANGSH
jgi:hypothetical protein